MKNARRKARELAIQAIYQWLVSHSKFSEILVYMHTQPAFKKADCNHFEILLKGVIEKFEVLENILLSSLDRRLSELSPVEHAALLVAAYELNYHPEIPYRVVINEAIEVTKTFGGTDGYRYVNGVLDRIAVNLRPNEAKVSKDLT